MGGHVLFWERWQKDTTGHTGKRKCCLHKERGTRNRCKKDKKEELERRRKDCQWHNMGFKESKVGEEKGKRWMQTQQNSRGVLGVGTWLAVKMLEKINCIPYPRPWVSFQPCSFLWFSASAHPGRQQAMDQALGSVPST